LSYTKGPYSLPTAIPPPDRSELSDSREIQFSTGTYVLADDGGFEPMSPVAQRVCLLVSFACGKRESFVTPQAMYSQMDRVRKALTVLTAGKAPAIRIDSLDAVRTAAGKTRLSLSFTDLTKQLSETVQL
jgi:hypothetical protein